MRTLCTLGLCLLAACGGSAAGVEPQPAAAPARKPLGESWDLVSAYQRAHREKDLGGALALMHLGSVDTTTRDTLIVKLTSDFERELVSARLLPLDGKGPKEYVLDGRRIVPNLEVTKRLRLEFATGSATEYFVGTLNGREMIATARYER